MNIKKISLIAFILIMFFGFNSVNAACWQVRGYYGYWRTVCGPGPGPWGPPSPGPWGPPGPLPPPPGPWGPPNPGWRPGPWPAPGPVVPGNCWRNWRGVLICN